MGELWVTIWPYLFGAAHLITIGLASAHVVLTKRDVRAAIGWVGIIWLTPFLGSLLYFTLGVNRIHRKARRIRRSLGLRDSSPGFRRVSDDVVQRILGDEDHLAPLVNYIGRLTHQPLLDGNRILPLIGGKATYDEMLGAIEGAQHSVALETYIFDNDSLGQRFVEALAAAKSRGVHVRVLVDSVGDAIPGPPFAASCASTISPTPRFSPR